MINLYKNTQNICSENEYYTDILNNSKVIICGISKNNGTLSDSIEYFYKAWQLDNNVKLIFTKSLPDFEFLNLKYNLDQSCYKNFFYINFNIIKKINFNSILSFAHYLREASLSGITFNCNNINIVLNDSSRLMQKARYFAEYPEFNFNDSIKYQYKMNFDIFKNYTSGNLTYIKDLKPTIESLKIHAKYQNILLENREKELGNIYNKINKFVYIKTNKSYDRHPRMFQECYYLNIPIDYYNLSNKNDGSTYRYNDLLNGIEHRYLKDNDIVLEYFLN